MWFYCVALRASVQEVLEGRFASKPRLKATKRRLELTSFRTFH